MPHEFQVSREIELAATREQVWEAIATGPGVDSWFMGRSEIGPGTGGRMRLAVGDSAMESTVTGWDPGKRLAYRTDESPDGLFMAFEYLIEGRDSGSTVLRFVHSGFLGDDWEAEYDALSTGDFMYLRKLAVYLEHFAGRTATSILFAMGPRVPDAGRVAAAFGAALGTTGWPAEGDKVRLTVDGVAPADGVVEFTDGSDFLGVRTADDIYMFIYAQETVVVERHAFAATGDLEPAWRAWFARAFA